MNLTTPQSLFLPSLMVMSNGSLIQVAETGFLRRVAVISRLRARRQAQSFRGDSEQNKAVVVA